MSDKPNHLQYGPSKMYDVRNTDPDAVTASSLKLYNYRVEEAKRRAAEEKKEKKKIKKERDREKRREARAKRKEEKQIEKEREEREAALL